MKNNRFLVGCIVAVSLASLVFACKDEFTEEDQLKLQQKLDQEKQEASQDSIALSIQVYNASISGGTAGGRLASTKGTKDITVKLSSEGKLRTGTTDENGIVNFFVKPGSVSGTLSAAGFTTINFTLSVTKPSGDLNHLTNASVTLPVFATSGTTVSKVSGNVTFEGNLLNNTRENVPDGKVTISFSPTQSSLESYYSSPNSINADVDKFTVEAVFIATVSNGTYSIELPTGAGEQGLVYSYRFSDFVENQSIAINAYDNDPDGSVRDVKIIPTQFTTTAINGNPFTNIPTVRSVQIDIAPPPAAGSGATATVKLLPKSIATNGFTIAAAGSGYPANTAVPINITGGDYDANVVGATPAALTANINANGAVQSISGTLGFGYRSQAKLTVGGGGSGAVITPNFVSTIAPTFGTDATATSGTTITNGGSGYVDFAIPALIVRGVDYFGNSKEGYSEAVVRNGQVVDIVGFFDLSGNPATFSKLTSTDVFFRSAVRVPASANMGDFYVNDGALYGGWETQASGIFNSGFGYNPSAPPVVTVRGLRGGTGAVLAGKVSRGFIEYLYVISNGTGYSSSQYANFPGFRESFATFGLASNSALRPGSTYALNAHYGTGIRSVAVN